MAVYIASWKGKRVLFVHCHLYIDRSVPQCPLLTAGHLEGERKKNPRVLWRELEEEGPQLAALAETGEKKKIIYTTCTSPAHHLRRRAMVKTCCILLYIAINIIHTLYKYINMLCATLPPLPMKLVAEIRLKKKLSSAWKQVAEQEMLEKKCWDIYFAFFLPVVFSPTLAGLSFAGSTVLVLYYLRKAREKFLKIAPSV